MNIGQRDLVGAEIDEVVGIFNSTSNYVIGQIEAGNSREDGVAEAQVRICTGSNNALRLLLGVPFGVPEWGTFKVDPRPRFVPGTLLVATYAPPHKDEHGFYL